MILIGSEEEPNMILIRSISVLHNRYPYYTIDFSITQSIHVVHKRSLYYTFDFSFTLNYSVLGKKKPNTEFHIKTVVFDLQIFTWLESYYKVDLFSVVIRHDRYLYQTIDICSTQSISVLHTRFLYYIELFCFGKKNTILNSI